MTQLRVSRIIARWALFFGPRKVPFIGSQLHWTELRKELSKSCVRWIYLKIIKARFWCIDNMDYNKCFQCRDLSTLNTCGVTRSILLINNLRGFCVDFLKCSLNVFIQVQYSSTISCCYSWHFDSVWQLPVKLHITTSNYINNETYASPLWHSTFPALS